MQDPTMLQAFKEYPVFFALSVLVGMVGALAGLIGVVAAARGGAAGKTLGVVALAMALASIGSGALGYAHQQRMTAMVLTANGLSERDRQRIREYSDKEAFQNLIFGVAASAPGDLLGVLAIILASRKKSVLRA